MNPNSIFKKLVTITLFLAALLIVEGKIPPEMSVVLSKQFGYSYDSDLMSSDDPIFVNYIHKNWREIADNIEWLPLTEGDRIPEKAAFNASVMHFGQTCESLPPLEYVDFFEKMLSLCEDGRISFEAIDFLYIAQDEKDCFFSVNWEHPKVQRIFERLRKLIPSEKFDFLSMVEDQSKGALEDNYLTNKSDDAPLPETLPGIKLKRPWGSLIKQYEQLTGKKVEVPYDPRFNPRLEKSAARVPTSISERSATVLLNPWFWMISGGLAIFIGVLLKARHNPKRSRKA